MSGSAVTCPHCGKETNLSVGHVVSRETKPAPASPPPQKTAAPTDKLPLINFVHCPCCGEKISRKASSCVKCGEPFPDNSAGWVIGFFAFIVFVIGAALAIDGISGTADNIMQQSYLQAREGFGLILMILAALWKETNPQWGFVESWLGRNCRAHWSQRSRQIHFAQSGFRNDSDMEWPVAF